MHVELRPFTAYNTAKRCEEDFGQDRIYVDGRQLGFVGRLPDSPILMCESYVAPDVREAICTAVREKYGGQQSAVNMPPELPDEAMDDDDDFDEED